MMITSFKKLLLVSITLLLGVMSAGVKAQQTNYDFNSTTYTLNIYNGTWSQFQFAESNYSNTPWWGDENIAQTFAFNVGTNLGFADNFGSSEGPFFAFSDSPLTTANYVPRYSQALSTTGWSESYAFNWVYVSYSSPTGAVVPEMDASLIPQVGLLLACLFFLLGRKKEVVEPMLAV
jgi:hypothetical protein